VEIDLEQKGSQLCYFQPELFRSSCLVRNVPISGWLLPLTLATIL
jgi:hypothetical protein